MNPTPTGPNGNRDINLAINGNINPAINGAPSGVPSMSARPTSTEHLTGDQMPVRERAG